MNRLPLTVPQKATDAGIAILCAVNVLFFVYTGSLLNLGSAIICAVAVASLIPMQLKTQAIRWETEQLRRKWLA